MKHKKTHQQVVHQDTSAVQMETAINNRQPAPQSAEGPELTELRKTVQALLDHYLQAEKRRYQAIPADHRDNHIFEHWVALLNWQTDDRRSPESFLDKTLLPIRVPGLFSVLVTTLIVSALLYLPVLFTL